MIPLSLYIHFPWCIRKCPYCDFNSHAIRNDLPEEKYITQLIKDLEHSLSLVQDRKIHSIFMGGGTPSLFSAASLRILLNKIKNLINFEKENIEITLEANPGTVEHDKFPAYLEAGINRISLGIQSFDKNKLKKLGRIHDDTAAFNAIENLKKSGFKNFNIDLMHGLPHQSLIEAQQDIIFAIQSLAPHISWYQLTLEPNTLFYHQPPILPTEPILENIWETGNALLKNSNYHHYEVSAYCRKGFECQHNLNYWHFGDYIGIGAGAHGKITNIHTQQIIRTQKPKNPKAYLECKNFSEISKEIVTEKKLPFEFMLNTLRLYQPISWSLFTERTFLDKTEILSTLENLAAKNLLSFNDNFFELTLLGKRFLNNVLTEFI